MTERKPDIRPETYHEHGTAGHAAHGDHGHHGHHGHDGGWQPLVRALALTAGVAVVEIVGGFASNSLALLADAGHMLTDVAALLLALFALWLGRRPARPGHTFGGRRWEVFAAWINGAALVTISGAILWEAVERVRVPPRVEGGLMLAVAVVGLGANALSAWWLHRASRESLNVRGAYLHVLADLGGSVATICAAALVLGPGWTVADPIASVAVALLVLRGAWRLVREATEVLLEATPRHIDLAQVRAALEGVPSVESVHDLHVWTVGAGVVAMSAHVVVGGTLESQGVLAASRRAMALLGIGHVTVQLEQPALPDCGDCVRRPPP
jgi:cobalt-zinc-cadmium efflux system protein